MEDKRTGIIIQARLGSTRLPNKILRKANNKPLLEILVNRLKKAEIPFYIATTVNPGDEGIVEFANTHSIPFYRGSENNVLERYYHCAKQFDLDIIIRITSDCPLIDASLIKKGLDEYSRSANPRLYFSNTIERTYPRGFDFEIFSFNLLNDAFTNATEESDKEHVTPYLWKNKPGDVDVKQLKGATDESEFRITVDTPEDYLLVKKLVEDYNAEGLSGADIISILRSNPELPLINRHIEQKKV